MLRYRTMTTRTRPSRHPKRPRRRFNFTGLRIMALLGALIFFGLTSAHQSLYSRNWTKPLDVVIYPINADRFIATQQYIDTLSSATFTDIETWASREADRWNIPLDKPFAVRLGDTVTALPPALPVDATSADTLIWGLKFRWWAHRHTPKGDASLTTVRMFVLYYDPFSDKPLAHSLGLQKGLLGVVHAYATERQAAQNNIVISHEMLHTVGASDKYEGWGGPVYPYGFTNPLRTPLFPQRSAEIMVGRIPTSHTSSYMAESLKSVQINRFTAAEINWIDH